MNDNPSRRYAWYVLLILTLTQLVNYVDRQVVAPLLPLIKQDLHLSDTQLGLLGTGFMIVHSIMAIPLGVVADRWERRKVVALGLGFWSIATVFSGLAKSFSQLMAARAAIGIGEAAYAPAATSMLNDLFPKSEWGKVIGIFNAGLFIGGAVGLILGGILGERIGWEACFFVVGLPGLVLTVVNWNLKEPPRGKDQKVKHDFSSVLTMPILWVIILAAACVTFSAGALVFWLPTFLVKYFAYTTAQVAKSFGPIAVAAGLLGVLSGGILADWLHGKTPAGRPLTLAFGFLLTVPFMIWGLSTTSDRSFLIATFFISYFMSWYHGPVAAIVTDIVPPDLRGTAIAFYMFGIHILGDTPSPAVVGVLSDRMGGELRPALGLMVYANVLAVALFLVVSVMLGRKAGPQVKAVILPAASPVRD